MMQNWNKICKNALLLGLTAAMTVGTIQPAQTYAANDIRVYVDGKQLRADVSPYTKDGYVLLPMRAVYESLGASVAYDAATKQISVYNGKSTVKLTIGQKIAYLDGKAVRLTVAPEVKNGRTMVGLRDGANLIEADIAWNNSERTANVWTNGTKSVDSYHRDEYGNIYDASFIGKTFGELKQKYGLNYRTDYLNGGQFVKFERSPAFFMDSRGSIGNSDKVTSIMSSADDALLDGLRGRMHYKEIQQVIGSKVKLEKPEYFENLLEGRAEYILEFTYKGYKFHYVWDVGTTGHDTYNSLCEHVTIIQTDATVKPTNSSTKPTNTTAAEKPAASSAVSIELQWPDTSRHLVFTLEDPATGSPYQEMGNKILDFENNVIATVEKSAGKANLTFVKDDADCIISVADLDWTPKDWTMNPLSDVNAKVTVKKGSTVVSSGDLELYRSYTGYWSGGVCNLDDGKIKDYKAVWM